MNEHDYSITIIGNKDTITYDLPSIEFEFMDANGLFDLINTKNNLLIDMYESETIMKSMTSDIISIISPYKDSIPIFYQAIQTLIDVGISADLDF